MPYRFRTALRICMKPHRSLRSTNGDSWVRGSWIIGTQAAVLCGRAGGSSTACSARSTAQRHGFVVPNTAVRFRVSIDERLPGQAHGLDVDEHGNGTITELRLHQLLRQKAPIQGSAFRDRISRRRSGIVCIHIRLTSRRSLQGVAISGGLCSAHTIVQ